MIIYNITTKVDSAIHADWLTWLKEEHIPEMINTGCFIKAVILQLLEIDESDGTTYALQYHAESKSLYNRYIEKFSQEMAQKSHRQWGDLLLTFPTVMQVVN